jgi:hypothetical protein
MQKGQNIKVKRTFLLVSFDMGWLWVCGGVGFCVRVMSLRLRTKRENDCLFLNNDSSLLKKLKII